MKYNMDFCVVFSPICVKSFATLQFLVVLNNKNDFSQKIGEDNVMKICTIVICQDLTLNGVQI
jgi:hypothetical protein